MSRIETKYRTSIANCCGNPLTTWRKQFRLDLLHILQTFMPVPDLHLSQETTYGYSLETSIAGRQYNSTSTCIWTLLHLNVILKHSSSYSNNNWMDVLTTQYKNSISKTVWCIKRHLSLYIKITIVWKAISHDQFWLAVVPVLFRWFVISCFVFTIRLNKKWNCTWTTFVIICVL